MKRFFNTIIMLSIFLISINSIVAEEYKFISTVDSSYCYIATEKAIYRTSDGGVEWEKIPVVIKGGIHKFIFTSRDTGYIASYQGATIYKTIDFGETWDSIYAFPVGIDDMAFLNSKIGYTLNINQSKYIRKTRDGGHTWTLHFSGSNQFSGRALSIVDSNLVYASSWCCDLSKSIDGGENWEELRNVIPGSVLSVTKIQFVDEIVGFMSAHGVDPFTMMDKSIFLTTHNGGENWEMYFFSNSGIDDIHFHNKNFGWILSEGLILHSNSYFNIQDTTDLWMQKFSFADEHNSFGINRYNVYKTEDGWLSYKKVLVLTDVKDNITMPKNFHLSNNYPNPFNPSTTINYSIKNQSFVVLKVFDVLGREIKSLVNKEQSVGNYSIEFDASNLTSGIYFYRIQAGQFVETKKMILLR